MVGIVLVSHSRELSAAVKALAEQQIQGRARLAAVGGSDNPHQPYGTDPIAIAEAIQSVFTEDGVLVLMDLGSAVISGRVALDLLEPAQAARVHLSVGPFVEGALAAAVQASIGMDLAAVAREAEEAMQAKRSVLLHEEEPPRPWRLPLRRPARKTAPAPTSSSSTRRASTSDRLPASSRRQPASAPGSR